MTFTNDTALVSFPRRSSKRRIVFLCNEKGNSVITKESITGSEVRRHTHMRRSHVPERTWHAKPQTGLERWISEQLCEIYAEVLSEPLPRSLVDLLEKFRRDKKIFAGPVDAGKGSNFRKMH